MNLFARAFASLTLVLAGLGSGCSPRKEDPPPAPKVTANVEQPAGQPVAQAAAMALPRLGAAPVWKLQDLDGKLVTSDQFMGKVVVVDFWATWCGPCRIEIPGYKEMQARHGKDGVVIIGMSVDQAGPEVVKAFAQKNEINYPMVMADEDVVTAFGGVSAIPTTFIIDRNGQVRYRKEGLEEGFDEKVLSVLKEQS